MKTTIVAVIIDGWPRDMLQPGIYQVRHSLKVNPIEAIKAAAREFVATPEGQEYLESDVGSDVFNWGDAIAAIPIEILRRHNVQGFMPVGLGNVVVVDHDEEITR